MTAVDRGRRWLAQSLTSPELLADLLSFDDGYSGRPLRKRAAELDVVRRWLATPRGRELDRRLWRPDQLLDPDPLRPPEPDPELIDDLRGLDGPPVAGYIALAALLGLVLIAALVLVALR